MKIQKSPLTKLALALGLFCFTASDSQALRIKAPEPAVGLNASVDRPVIHRDSKNRRVIIRIDVEGRSAKQAIKRQPLNLAVVLDRSGSMTGAKLEQAKQAASMLVDQLDHGDIFSLVIYDTEVETLVPAQRIGDRRKDILRKIDAIRAGGSTALYHGVERGGDQLREFLKENRLNRVMLLSDGIANVGPSSNREIAHLGQQLAREEISVTTIGLGDNYNENLMTALAEASDANYYYVADVEQLPGVFEEELGELKSVIATNIEIEIMCLKGVRPIRFLGRPDKLDGSKNSLHFKTIASEQSRQLFLECELDGDWEGPNTQLAEITVSYEDATSESRERVDRRQYPLVRFTDDGEEETKHRDTEIVAQAAIYKNAAETEKAIALADQGNIEACRIQLKGQMKNLQEAWSAAPVGQKTYLRREIEAVAEAEADLERNDRFSKSQRKVLQSGAFELRNSKRSQ